MDEGNIGNDCCYRFKDYEVKAGGDGRVAVAKKG